MGAPLGNQNGRQAKIWQQAIKRALARRVNGVVDDGLDQAAEKFLDAVFAGEQWALRELGDRMDGRAAQAVAVTGEDGGPLQVEKIVREVVRANS